jgi:hypothetical protein
LREAFAAGVLFRGVSEKEAVRSPESATWAAGIAHLGLSAAWVV